MAAIMEADVTAVCGTKGRHDPERTAVRHGHRAGPCARPVNSPTRKPWRVLEATAMITAIITATTRQ